DVGFDPATHKLKDGDFHVDMTGTELRVADQFFPLASSIMEVHWEPATGTFTMAETAMNLGAISTKASGVFVLGLDDLYGPTVAISMTNRDVNIRPSDLPEPEAPFDTISFKGWSAP